jgi:hypothetical protein
MNTANEEPKATEPMQSLKQQAEPCGASCGCHCSGISGKARWGICAIVLFVAGLLVMRAMTKPDVAAGTSQSWSKARV